MYGKGSLLIDRLHDLDREVGDGEQAGSYADPVIDVTADRSKSTPGSYECGAVHHFEKPLMGRVHGA